MRKKRQKWTDEMLRDEALKYKTRGAFRNESRSAYDTARRRGIIDSVCSHMEYVNTYWSDEMLFSEARKYNTRSEFENGSPNAYTTARRREILEKVCKHMGKLPHQDKPHCVYLIEIFTKNNELYYYVGQSCNLAERLRMHFRRKDSYTTVSDFLNKNPIKYKKHYIIKNNLTFKDSLELEKNTIKDLNDRGIKLLNKELYL